MKHLFIGFLSVLVIFGGMFYLVSNTVSVGAEKETPVWVSETHDTLTTMRQLAKDLDKEIYETKQTLKQLEYQKVRNRKMRLCLVDKLVAENGESVVCEIKGPIDVLEESFNQQNNLRKKGWKLK